MHVDVCGRPLFKNKVTFIYRACIYSKKLPSVVKYIERLLSDVFAIKIMLFYDGFSLLLKSPMARHGKVLGAQIQDADHDN